MSRSLAILAALLAFLPLAGQEPGRVLELWEVETPPVVRNTADFQAALAARHRPELLAEGVEGVVLVAFVVDVDGSVREPEVVEASHEGLSAPTVAAVRVLRFAPATVGRVRVAVRAALPVEWRRSLRLAPDIALTSVPAESREEALRRLIGDDPALAAMAAEAYELNEVEEMPRPLNTIDLARALQREYPDELRAAGISGRLTVRILVGADGAVYLAHVTRFTHPGFVEPILRALAALRFRPSRVGGRPVPTWVELPIAWTPGGYEGPNQRRDPR